MAKFDWDKWNLGWVVGLPKNEMWAKVRDGGSDAAGNPTFRYENKPDKSSADPMVIDTIAQHRFIFPAIETSPGSQHCFCGWAGVSHTDHLIEMVESPHRPAAVKAPVKKAPARRAAKKAAE